MRTVALYSNFENCETYILTDATPEVIKTAIGEANNSFPKGVDWWETFHDTLASYDYGCEEIDDIECYSMD